MSAYGTDSYMMAAEATAEIVSQKLEILLSRLDWVGCSSMETLVKDAKAKLAMIQKLFSTQDRPSKTTEWWRRFLRTMYDAEDFLDKFQVKVARGRHEALHVAMRPLAALVHKYVLWKDLSNLVKAMKQLCRDQSLRDEGPGGEGEKQPASSSSHATAPGESQKLARLTNFWDRQASMNFLCYETKKEYMKKRIRMESEGVHGISIWGKPGTGKTFLARWVYSEAMYLGFETQAWVHVSASMDKREFLLDVLKQVDRQARDMMDFDEIKIRLRCKLAEKRFLIVLDDVPSDVELLKRLVWEVWTIPLHEGHIITTTQDHTIAEIMESDERGPIELENLRLEDSRRMLAMKLRRGPHVPSLTPEEDKILNRFPALPLCMSLLGGLLLYAKEC